VIPASIAKSIARNSTGQRRFRQLRRVARARKSPPIVTPVVAGSQGDGSQGVLLHAWRVVLCFPVVPTATVSVVVRALDPLGVTLTGAKLQVEPEGSPPVQEKVMVE
jgi:hypothetical protein